MGYEIITPDGKNLYLRVHIDTEDTMENRRVVHKVRKLLEKLKNKNEK